MKRLRDLPDDILFFWWSEQSAGSDYAHVSSMAKLYAVDPYDVTIPKVRRYLKKRLHARRMLPTNRAPTAADYELVKTRILTARQHVELN